MTDIGTTIGWIGTGIMKAPMCGHLLARGYRVRLHTRTLDEADRMNLVLPGLALERLSNASLAGPATR